MDYQNTWDMHLKDHTHIHTATHRTHTYMYIHTILHMYVLTAIHVCMYVYSQSVYSIPCIYNILLLNTVYNMVCTQEYT